MADVVEINDLEQLEAYAADWNNLFQRTPRASFFHTYEWFVTHWKHFSAGCKMRVLIVRSGETVTGIMPLCIVEEQHRLSTVKVLTYPLCDWGMWYGPLGPHQSATMFMALQHLRKTTRDWDKIDLRWTPANPAGHDITRRAMAAMGWKPQREVYQQSSLIHFENNNWENFFASLNKKWRHEIRRQERNLAKLGEVEFVRHRPAAANNHNGDPRWELFDECVAVSRQSWQANVTNGNTICHARVLPFIKECHAQAARLGMVDMAVLRLNGKPLAYQYNYHYQGEVFGLRMGYASTASDLGVGKILLARFLQDSFTRGDKVLDLGIGDFDFKARFRTGIATSHHYSYSPWNSWRSQSVRLSQWLRQTIVGDEPMPAKPAVA
jgi:CelD/BcsL family acetyltransferase involved in cellulose biosynthesis